MGRICTGCVQEYMMGWWIGCQNPSIALVRLKWGCAALGNRWPGYGSAAACWYDRSLALGEIKISILWQEIRR